MQPGLQRGSPMSNDQRFMSIRGYGKLRGVAESTLRFHIRSGTIVLDKHGRVDREQADAAWARRRRQSSTPGERRPRKIRRARAQLALAQDEVANLDDEYADAAEAREQYQAEAAYVIATLQAMPAIEAASVQATRDFS